MYSFDWFGRAQDLAAGRAVGAQDGIVRQLIELCRSMDREIEEHHERRLLGAR